MTILLTLYKCSMQLIYFFFKLMPIKKNRILFLSRQENKPSIDFSYIIEDIKKRYPEYESKVLTKRMEKTNIVQILSYVFHPYMQLFYLARSKICIIDGYQMAVSTVHHKRELKIVQIWHSMGAIKKFGCQVPKTKKEESIARIMHMHENYDVIVSSSEAMKPYFAEAFGYDESKFITCALPRMDYLKDTEETNRKKVYEIYPELRNKRIVLYAPTFRTYDDYRIDELIEALKDTEYELIIKIHPRMKIKVDSSYTYQEVSSLELLSVADYVITDYSAISIEAAILNKPVLLYVYDYERYDKVEGINTNLYEDLKGYVFKDIENLKENIFNKPYDMSILKKYRDTYVIDSKNATIELVDQILGGKK